MFLKKQKELAPSEQYVELKKLSDTRWACQYSALCAIKKTLPAIQATLQDVIGQTNAKRKADARALHGLIDEQFVLNLTLFELVFRVTKFAATSYSHRTLISRLRVIWFSQSLQRYWKNGRKRRRATYKTVQNICAERLA